MKKKINHRDLALAGMFAALMIVLTFVAYIPLPLFKLTLMHIPVIIGSIVLGPRYGAFLGFLFGFTSLLTNTFSPTLISFAFTPFYNLPGFSYNQFFSLIVCFIPRILVGIVPYYVYRGIQLIPPLRKDSNPLPLIGAGIVGSLTNTVGVLGLIYVLFQNTYATAKGIDPSLVFAALMTTVSTNGVPEIIIAAIAVPAIGIVLIHLKKRTEGATKR